MLASNARAGTPELPNTSKASGSEGLQGSSPSNQDLSVAFSETDTLNPSSPELPPISAPKRGELLPNTPAASKIATNKSYYTASWGSPYDNSVPPAGSHNRQFSEASVEDLERTSPDPQFGLSHLVPSRLPANTTIDSTPARPSSPNFDETPRPKVPSKPTHASTPSRNFATAFNTSWKFLRSRFDDIQGAVQGAVSISPPSPPPAKGNRSRDQNKNLRQEEISPAVSKMESSRFASPQTQSQTKIEAETKPNSQSLKRAEPQKPPVTPSKDANSNYNKQTAALRSPTIRTTPMLPDRPSWPGRPMQSEKRVEQVKSPQKERTNKTEKPDKPEKPEESDKSEEPAVPIQRKKTKFIVKGKPCYVNFPLEGAIKIKPLTNDQIRAGLEFFEELGYDTRGFQHGDGVSSDDIYSQNCAIYPDPSDVIKESHTKKRRVYIPNRSEWTSYVNALTESKLAALGVSLGGESEAVPMSRQNSSPYVFSPPLRTSSAGSHRATASMAGFAPGFVPGHSSTRSIASPAGSFSNHRMGHMHRHSVFAGSPMVPPTTISPLPYGTFSPQSLSKFTIAGSATSPAFSPGSMDLRSPISPFGSMAENIQSYPFARRNELLDQMQRQQFQSSPIQVQTPQRLQTPILPIRPASTLAEVPEADSEEESQPSQITRSAPPEIQNPKPGHRHNISAKLEETIQKTGFSLNASSEKSEDSPIEKDLEPESQSQSQPQTQVQPQPHREDKSKSLPEWRRTAGPNTQPGNSPKMEQMVKTLVAPTPSPLIDEAKTVTDPQSNDPIIGSHPIESLSAIPGDKEEASLSSSAMTNQWEFLEEAAATQLPETPDRRPQFDRGHSAKSSGTRFNVEAKEFNPTGFGASFNAASLTPSKFSVQTNSFIPKNQSDGITSAPVQLKPSFNVHAPAFNINAPAFNPSSSVGADLSKSEGAFSKDSKSEFSFSSKALSFNPSAPSFQPGSSMLSSDQSFGSPTSDTSSRIFSNINFSELVKNGQSVPAVNSSEPELLEDDTGRLANPRSKRARRGGDDGNDIPRFHKPRPELEEDIVADENPEENSLLDDPIPSAFENQEEFSFVESTPHQEVPETVENKVLLKSLSLTQDDIEPEASSTPQLGSSVHLKAGSSHFSPFAEPFKPQFSSPVAAEEIPSRLKNLELKDRRASDSLISPPSSITTFRGEGENLNSHLDFTERSVSSPPGNKFTSLPSSVRYYDDTDMPFHEIDAVMQQLNETSDYGVERAGEKEDRSWPESSQVDEQEGEEDALSIGMQPELKAPFRSDAPSPSPRRALLQQDIMNDGDSGDPFSDGRAARYESPVRKQVNAPQVSDWDEFSSADEAKIHNKTNFQSSNVSDLIHSTLEERLSPLEQHLLTIQESLAEISKSRSRSNVRKSRAPVDSDADDEEDDEADFRSRGFSRSPIRDRKMDKFRSVLQDVLATHRRSQSPVTQQLDLTEIMAALAEVKGSIAESSKLTQGAEQPALNHEDVRSAVTNAIAEHKLVENIQASVTNAIQLDDVKAAVEMAMSTHAAALTQTQRNDSAEETSIMSELLQKNSEAIFKAAEEAEARKQAERKELESSRLLKLAEEELSMLKSNTNVDSERVDKLENRAKTAETRLVQVEAAAEEFKAKAIGLSESNAALKATIDDYRHSQVKWREDFEKAIRVKEKLASTFGTLKLQADEAVRIRETMRDRLEKLQSDAAKATADIVDERSRWQRQDLDNRSKYEMLQHRITAESRTRERFEKELERLEHQEKEAMKLRHIMDHMAQEKNRMQHDIDNLLAKQREASVMAINFAHIQKEHVKLEQLLESHQKDKDSQKQIIESLKTENNDVVHKAGLARMELEYENARLKQELENLKVEHDNHRTNHSRALANEIELKNKSIHEVSQTKATALEEQKHTFEERMEAMRKQHRRDLDHTIENKNQSETFLRDTHTQRIADLEQLHQRALEQSIEDRDRLEADFNARFELSNSKIEMYEDKVANLEERLEIQKSAAAAAVQAVHAAKSPNTTTTRAPPSSVLQPTTIITRNEGGLNSQALRETISVLQDQLQERESRIDALETESANFDQTLPQKVKAKDVEVNWLRELLGVRLDDLGELVTVLSREDYDRNAVRNAAIRIRSTLQMELHKETSRGTNSGLLGGNIAASLSSFATPRAAQLAKALGDWRSNSSTPSRRASPANSQSGSATGTRSGFLGALMTPPPSSQNVRRAHMKSSVTGSTPAPRRISKGKAPAGLRNVPSIPAQEEAVEEDDDLESESESEMDIPRTPPLLEDNEYDGDATDGQFTPSRFGEDGDEEVEAENGEVYGDEQSRVEATPRATRRDSSTASLQSQRKL